MKFGRAAPVSIGGALLIFICLFGPLGSVSSKASTVNITYTGVANGKDGTGLFGIPGTDLTGKTYVATYVFDVTFGLNNNNFASADENFVEGGSAFSPLFPLSPNLGATLTINGISLSLVGTKIGDIFAFNNGSGSSEQLHEANNGPFVLINEIVGSALPASIASPFSYTVTQSDTASGSLVSINNGVVVSTIFLTPSSLTESLTPLGATPLPAALPLFATGLGVMGLLGWRKKRKKAAGIAAA